MGSKEGSKPKLLQEDEQKEVKKIIQEAIQELEATKKTFKSGVLHRIRLKLKQCEQRL